MQKTPFLHLLPPRLKAALSRLKNSIWTLDPRPLPVRASTPTRNHTSFHNRPPTPHPIENLPHFWGKPFEQRWWQIEFPSHLLSSYSHLCWKDQAEATLYLDGFPSGGFDPAHHFVPLKPNFKEAIIESYCTQAAIWVPGSSSKINSEGSRFEGAYLAKKNPIAWQNYFDFSVLFDLARWLASRDPNIPNQNSLESSLFYRHEWHEADPILRYLIHHLDLAVELWETNGPLAMSKKLREIFDHLSQPLPNLHATTIGHAHIDLVWLWPEDITEAKLVHTFSTVERLLDQYPEFIFSHSQPAAYRLLKKRSPELYNQVLSRIQQSRWEPVGALEVEADTFLPTGEALARSFLLGQQQFQNISGYKSLVLWLPDSFGFSASIPTLMAEFDVPFFFSAKLAWSESSRFPYTSFRWRGMDGSEVIAHLLHDYAAAYNRMGNLPDILLPLHAHRQAHIHPEILIPLGMGDGGGGPSEETCERIRRYNSLFSTPRTSWGKISDFFNRMLQFKDNLPSWDGEILLEYHRGTYTTQTRIKQAYRQLESALQTLEATKAIANSPLDDSDLHTWQRLCFAQFHDCLPGSSIAEVYHKIVPELQLLADLCIKKTHHLASQQQNRIPLNQQNSDNAFFNPLPLPINFPLSNGLLLHLPPLATRPTSLASPPPNRPEISESDFSLRCGNSSVKLLPDATIAELTLNGTQLKILPGAAQVRCCPDFPAEFHAWNLDRNTPPSSFPLHHPPQFLGFSLDNLSASAKFAIQLTAKSDLLIEFLLSADLPVLRINLTVNWNDPQTLLQIIFPTSYCGSQARFGAPFGSVLRPQLARGLQTDALFEVPASRWALVANDTESEGLAIITRDRYGFGAHRGTLHCSLLRSPILPGKTPEDQLSPTDFSDLGQHKFQLALAPASNNAPLHLQPPSLADSLFTKPIPASPNFSPPEGLFSLHNAHSLIPAWVKPAQNHHGWILRLHETRGNSGNATLIPNPNFRISLTNLQESTFCPLHENTIPFSPYSIRSVLFSPR